jgi:hypothetical protein
MPRKAIDYSNTVIYKIVCNDLNVTDIYVGHTTNFTKRKNQHKTVCCNVNDRKHNLKVYQIIRDNGGWENWSMIEVEKLTCADENEARARERYWYEELKANMNSYRPYRSGEEFKEQRILCCRIWYKENPKYHMTEHIREGKRKYDQQEHVKEKKRNYNRTTYTCACGVVLSKGYSSSKHLVTRKHQDYLKSITTVEQPETELPHSTS